MDFHGNIFYRLVVGLLDKRVTKKKMDWISTRADDLPALPSRTEAMVSKMNPELEDEDQHVVDINFEWRKFVLESTTDD